MQQTSPIIVNIVPAGDQQAVSFVDVILGSFALTALAVVLAVLLGCFLAWILIRWHRRHPPELDRLPPVV